LFYNSISEAALKRIILLTAILGAFVAILFLITRIFTSRVNTLSEVADYLQTAEPTLTTPISREKAIESAVYENSTGHLIQIETPKVVSAGVMTYIEAQVAISSGDTDGQYDLSRPHDTLVWLVILEGKWELGQVAAATEAVTPVPNSTPYSPFFSMCYAIIGAVNGGPFISGCRP
jgi:hypothetical protein